MYHIIEEVMPYLPQEKPTYLMGVGTPENILEAGIQQVQLAAVRINVSVSSISGRQYAVKEI